MDEISLEEILINVKAFGRYLKTKWVYLLLAGMIGGLLGMGYYYMQTPKYVAECTFILEEKSGGGGGLAGIASQFGLDVGGMGTGSSIFSGDNILEIIPSKNIVRKVLLSKIDNTSEQTMADLFIQFNKLDTAWHKTEKLGNISFAKIIDPEKMTLIQDSILNVIYKTVTKSYLTVDWARKKASLIKVSVTSKNEKFSKFFTERVVEEASKLYISIKTGTSQTNINKLQQKADSLYVVLTSKSYEAAESQVLNANPAMKQALVPIEITARDKAIAGTIYTEVIKNLITSKLLLSQQTPVIQVLDNSDFPLEGKLIGPVRLTFIGAVSFLLFSFILSLIFFLLKKQK